MSVQAKVAFGVPVTTHAWRLGRPAAYTFREAETPYYVGFAANVPRRLQEHRRAGLGRLDPDVVDVSVYGTVSIKAAQRLERNLILFWEPKANDALPKVSENEKAWFRAIAHATEHEDEGEDRAWGYCPDCGELQVRLHDTFVPATRGNLCGRCLATPHWEPSEKCWTYIAGVAAGLVGQPVYLNEYGRPPGVPEFQRAAYSTSEGFGLGFFSEFFSRSSLGGGE